MQETPIYRYCGAIHIHTTFSDGTGDLKTIVKAAKKAGLSWIIVTDHNSMDIEEGIFDGIYVIRAEEISPNSQNHYLALGTNSVIYPSDNPQEYVDKVREQGGFGFAAHPDEGFAMDKNGNPVPRKNSHHCIPWTDKNVIPDGVEIWNWFSNWADNLDDRNLLTLAYAFFFKHKNVKNPSVLTLNWWDKLNNDGEKIVPALGGVDAHALLVKDYLIPLYIFPYTVCFKTINNVINLKEPLSKDFEEGKKQILNAVINGDNIIINRHIEKRVPDVYVTNKDGCAFCGEGINLDENTKLNIRVNKKSDLRVLLNGKEIYSARTKACSLPIAEKGKYRVEFFRKGRGFAYTNPIVVK